MLYHAHGNASPHESDCTAPHGTASRRRITPPASPNQSCGGLDQSCGGLDQFCGGLDQSCGGLDQSCGGLDQSCGGLDQSCGGLDPIENG